MISRADRASAITAGIGRSRPAPRRLPTSALAFDLADHATAHDRAKTADLNDSVAPSYSSTMASDTGCSEAASTAAATVRLRRAPTPARRSPGDGRRPVVEVAGLVNTYGVDVAGGVEYLVALRSSR